MSGVWARTGVACENTLLQVWVSKVSMCLHSLNPFWLIPLVVSPKGQPPRTRLTRPSVRILSLFSRIARRKVFTPLNQPLSVGLADAAASGSVPAFPAGNLDWLVAFLQQIMSPEDYQKYKSSFGTFSCERGGSFGGAIGQQDQGKEHGHGPY